MQKQVTMKYSVYFILTTFLFFSFYSFAQTKSALPPVDYVDANDTCQKIDKYLSQLTKEKNFSGGLLIIMNGEKIFSKGYGMADKVKAIPFNSATLGSIGSITKAFTATAIMKLVEQGKLKTDDKLVKFFPEVPADKSAITIHQLLTHSSGFHEFLENDGGDFEKLETKEFLQRAFAQPLAFSPGTKAVYTNVGMSVLAVIIEKISGLDYESFLQKELFQPVGIKNISYCYPGKKDDVVAHGYKEGNDWGTHQKYYAKNGGGPYWNLKGNGGLEASLNDMFLWANAFTSNTILKKETIEQMFSKQIVEDGTNGNYYFGYGCNIALSRRNTKLIDNGGSNGIYFARLIRLPEEGIVFYMVTNESSINANMILPNVTQLFFKGEIVEDAINASGGFDSPVSKRIYELIDNQIPSDLNDALAKEKIDVNDDMVLYEVGQRLINENKPEKALCLYNYYTSKFPKIIVAWNDLGDVYRMKGNKEEAIRCYKQALALKPENKRAKENLEQLGIK